MNNVMYYTVFVDMANGLGYDYSFRDKELAQKKYDSVVLSETGVVYKSMSACDRKLGDITIASEEYEEEEK